MPIYEFYCANCNVIFSFFSRKVNVSKIPGCPRCEQDLQRILSKFAVTGRAKEEKDSGPDLPVDEARMEQAMAALAQEAEQINEEDPRQAAQLMRKFSDMTGLQLGKNMQEALRRMEAGEDPESIEDEMGDLLEDEDPFSLSEDEEPASGKPKARRPAPERDEKLYEM